MSDLKASEKVRQLDDDTDEDSVGLLTMDGFDDCILGVAERFGGAQFVAYDLEKVIAKLVSQGMTLEEAREFYEFNQLGAWVGDQTPCFVRPLDG